MTDNTLNTPDYDDPRFPAPDPYAPLAKVPSFTVTSNSFTHGEKLPESLTGSQSVSPQLSWSDVPEGTKSFAITCFDPDAPTTSGFWHWAVLNIPADVTSVEEGAGSKGDLGLGGDVLTLKGDSGQAAFYGAEPPAGHGPHRYLFAVHAVDSEKLDVDPSDTPTRLGFNLNFHSLGRAITWGWYEN